ncbi:MAG: hypothetical protein SWJ54_04325 [Cyanobacteriota bacterium]|nr:hypothetical protein [Cyanobacteriota bacterium]
MILLEQQDVKYTAFAQTVSQFADDFEVQQLQQFLENCKTQKKTDSPALEIPPSQEMDVLYKLALLGSLRKIKERANYLEELDPKYIPFAQKLKTLAQEFKDEEIIALIEKYLSVS